MEYKVLSSSSPQGLTEKVNGHVAEGYTPTGGNSQHHSIPKSV